MAGENLNIHFAAAVAFAAGVPAYTWQSGAATGVITDTGVGDISLNFGANAGFDAAESIVLMGSRGNANMPRIAQFSCVHTSDIAKQILCTLEAAAGAASVAADEDFDIIVLKEGILGTGQKRQRAVIHFAATVAFAAGVPAYTWQSGEGTGVITDTGVGDITINFGANDGVDAAECAVVCSPINVGAAFLRRVGFTVTHTSDIAKQIEISQEAAAGGASVAADIGFSILIAKENTN